MFTKILLAQFGYYLLGAAITFAAIAGIDYFQSGDDFALFLDPSNYAQDLTKDGATGEWTIGDRPASLIGSVAGTGSAFLMLMNVLLSNMERSDNHGLTSASPSWHPFSMFYGTGLGLSLYLLVPLLIPGLIDGLEAIQVDLPPAPVPPVAAPAPTP